MLVEVLSPPEMMGIKVNNCLRKLCFHNIFKCFQMCTEGNKPGKLHFQGIFLGW
jgi:hypothetical protein